MARFGPWKIPKCLENGPFWDQQWVKNGSKTHFSKSDPGPFGMLKQVFLARFEPVLTEFTHFHHMYAPLCALRTYLRPVWWSHLELGEGCRLEGIYLHIYIYIYICMYICIYICILLSTPLSPTQGFHHTALRYARRVQLGALWPKGLNWVKLDSKWAKNICLSIPNGPGSLLEKRVLDPFLSHFWSHNGPFARHLRIFYGAKCVATGSKWAEKTCLSIHNGVGSLLEKNPFWTHFSPIFGPKTAPFQGILGFAMAQSVSPRAHNSLKTLV